MIGKTLQTNITTDVSKFLDDKNQLAQKQCEIKNKIENLNKELEDLKESMSSCVSVDDISVLVQDIKNSFELFASQTPRSNDDEIIKRLNALEAKVAEIPDMKIIQSSSGLPIDNTTLSSRIEKREIPKLNISKKKPV